MSNNKIDPPVIPAERGDDLHGLEHASNADLVLFMAGNQFMAMDDLIGSFQNRHPKVRRIFYETLPPGLELNQILAGGASFGDTFIDTPPDVYSSVSKTAVRKLADRGFAREDRCFVYLKNRLSIMVGAGNPLGIKGPGDLARDEVRVSQPNPDYEDIAEHILNMYRDAGGEDLVREIMERKREEGATIMTTVHHRETPERILSGKADAGPVWATEVMNARTRGLPLEGVEVGERLDQRDRILYYICPVEKGANPDNAAVFLDFIKTPDAQVIYAKYGFTKGF